MSSQAGTRGTLRQLQDGSFLPPFRGEPGSVERQVSSKNRLNHRINRELIAPQFQQPWIPSLLGGFQKHRSAVSLESDVAGRKGVIRTQPSSRIVGVAPKRLQAYPASPKAFDKADLEEVQKAGPVLWFCRRITGSGPLSQRVTRCVDFRPSSRAASFTV
jgi:hypothetical protein